MQCQALTHKGTHCKNRAVIPGNNPKTCRIASHIAQFQTQKPVSVNLSSSIGSTRSTAPIKRIVPPTVPLRPRTGSIVSLQTAQMETQLHHFLERKQQIISILDDLYAKGLTQSGGDHLRAIEYLMRRFTPQIYDINKKKLAEGLILLDKYQNDLISTIQARKNSSIGSDPLLLDRIAFLRLQSQKTRELLTILKNLYEEGGGSRHAMADFLVNNAMEDLKVAESLSSAPSAASSKIATKQGTSSGTTTTKARREAVALKTKR